jgi:uncharacterized membrane protein
MDRNDTNITNGEPQTETPGFVSATLVGVQKWVWVEMLTSAILGLVAAFILSVDAVKLAANPLTNLSCNINEKISCATVGLSPQAHLWGFPNSFLGLVTEPVVITIAVVALTGISLPKWFMLAAQTMYTAGFMFAWWLFYQAFFIIGALCPWCLLVTATTTVVFMSMTRANITAGNFGSTVERVTRVPLRLGTDWAVMLIAFAAAASGIVYKYF